MRTLRVIGLGSPFGDDRVGWLAVERLRRTPGLPPRLQAADFLLLDRPGIALIDAIRGADAAVLADGVRSGAAPGTLHRLTGVELAQAERPLSSHDLGVASAIALAAALGEMPAFVVLHGIEIDDRREPGPISRAVARRLPALVRAMRAELELLQSAAAAAA